MIWLDKLLYGLRWIYANGVLMPERQSLDFKGCTVVDNPTTGRTEITPAGGGGPPTYTQIQSACASATGALTLNGQRIAAVADPVDAQEVATRAFVLANAGAPSRTIALDAHDVIEWNFDEAAVPWANTGNGGALDMASPDNTVRPMVGGSMFGDRWAITANADLSWHFARTALTSIGTTAAGTIHGWFIDPPAASASYGPFVVLGAVADITANPAIDFVSINRAPSGAWNSFQCAVGDSGLVNFGSGANPDDVDNGYWSAQRGQWHHVALTWGSGELRFYLDGRQHPRIGTYSTNALVGGPVQWTAGALYRNLFCGLSKWRVCDVARSAAYIDEVYRRATGRWS